MKRLFLILSLVCLTIPGLAEQISRDQALRIAQQFLSQKGLPSSVKAAETALSRRRAQGIIQPDYYYVFNNGQNQGFVIVSGDDRTTPVLGFSDHGSFDVDQIPSNMAAWLQGYADQIKWIQEHPSASAVTRGEVPTHSAISDLITTKWNQGSPYNDLLPTWEGQKCVTGCGPTALAQIMNYYGAPASCPDIPGYTTETHGIVCEALPATTFNWSNMGDDAEVAKLFKYIAYAVQADFDPEGTSSNTYWICNALTNIFGYGNGIQTVMRSTYKDADWDMLIYNELAEGRPVFYSGQASVGGHFFIVHGYTVSGGVGYYSVNWGWGSLDDGYYLLDAMDPSSMGAGNGFNFSQTAIVGISTSDVTPYQVEETVVLTTGSISLPEGDNTYTRPAGYSQFGPVSINIQLKSELTRAYPIDYDFKVYKDGEFLEYLYRERNSFGNFPAGAATTGTWTFYFPDYDGVSLGASFKEPGTYKMVPVSRETGTSEWYDNIGSDKYYLTGVVSSDMVLKMYVGEPEGSTDPDPSSEVSQAELAELAALYEAQRIAINDKRTALASNDAKLTAISTSLSQKNTEALKAQITAIEEKLKSEYLTADQKKSYTDELDALKTKLDALVSECTAANTELSSLQAKSASLMSTLNNLLATLLTEAEKVSSITTKAALETSQTKVADIAKDQSACDVSAETTKVAALETTVATISATEVETGLTTLESTVDAAIKAAKDAIEEENKKQLETEKNALVETCDQLLSALSAKQEIVASNEKKILDLEAAISQAMDAVEPVEKKIAAIKESLKSDMLTDEQKTAFEGTLETLEKTKATYADAVKTLSNQLKDVKDANDVFKTALNEIKTKIDDLKTAVKAVTTTDALNNAKEATDAVKTQLQEISETDVEKDVLTLQAELEKLSLDSTTKDLAALEDDVDKAIAGGQEAYEKLQAEKLAKAQDAFKAAIGVLDETIEAQEADYDKCMEVINILKALMAEINTAIPQMKAQYAEIEKKFKDFIDKKARTRSDDSEVIEKLQQELAELNESIGKLESQREQIALQIVQLDQQAKDYADVIAAAKTSRQTLYDALSSATTADEVDKLTASVNKAKLDLASEGTGHYNLLAKNCNAVTDYVRHVADNVNVVDKTIKIVEMQVEEVVTAINQLIIDESEVVARYDMKGNPVDSTYKGMQIIRLKNGKTIKLNVK